MGGVQTRSEATVVFARSTNASGSFLRRVGFPVFAVAVIVASADFRMPLALPGHRGLVWLSLLVAVTLLTRTRLTVVAVGAASTMATLVLHSATGPSGDGRYLAAAVLLYAVAAVPVVGRHRWLIVLAAAPIHLVALTGSVAALFSAGYLSLWGSVGMTEKALLHMGFGLAAGLLGWAVAASIDRFDGKDHLS